MTARTRILLLSLLLLTGLLAVGMYLWTPQPAREDSGPAIARAAVAEGIKIAPHRALYDLHLADVKNDSGINNAGGQLLFTWGDACDGWTIEQRLDLAFSYTEGGRQRIQTSLASWEAKTGDSFRFSVRRLVNGQQKEVFEGKAQLARDGSGQALYTQPEAKTVQLKPDTLFPTVHTLQLLRRARAATDSGAKDGTAIFTRNVFDGADAEGQNEITAFIGKPLEITAGDDAKLQLANGRGWPMHLAFFAPEVSKDESAKAADGSGMPDYEMSMTLMENGVAHDLVIDYGDFTVNATLRAIEPLPAPQC